MLYMLTAVVVAPGGISTVHITHNNTLKQNTLNGKHIAIRILKYSCTKLYFQSYIH